MRNSGFIAHRRKGNLVLWVSFTTTHWSISFQIKARIIICNACPISKAVFRRLLLIPTHKLYTFHDLIGPVKIRRLVWRSKDIQDNWLASFSPLYFSKNSIMSTLRQLQLGKEGSDIRDQACREDHSFTPRLGNC